MTTAPPVTVRVDLGPRSYDILVGDGVLAEAGALLAPLLPRRRAVVVTDETVADLHLEALAGALGQHDIGCEAVALPPGEQAKSFAELERLSARLLELEVARDDIVVALGGGVVGDLAGFAAAVLRRGVGFVQIPTTLLAQVDSSVGGKTGINTAHGKNLIGAFHQPRMVLADVGVLATLPARERLAGYAEVAKYGLLGDADFFHWLEGHGTHVAEGDVEALTRAVVTSCEMKAHIVAADERESGDRALLNLGHTFGHALEAEVGYDDRLRHGEAVAIGMVLAFELSARLELCPADDAARVRRHLAAVGLPTSPGEIGNGYFEVEALLRHMRQDKKVRDGQLTFVLVRGIGDAFVSRDVATDDVAAVLQNELAT